MRRPPSERWLRIGIALAIILAVGIVALVVDSEHPEDSSRSTAATTEQEGASAPLTAAQQRAADDAPTPVAVEQQQAEPPPETEAVQAQVVEQEDAPESPAAVQQQGADDAPTPVVDEQQQAEPASETESTPAPEQQAEPEWRIADQAALAALTVAPEGDGGVPYDRDDYDHYLGRDENGCNLRDRILLQDAVRVISVTDRCDAQGEWLSWLDGRAVSDESELQIDHLVALAEAHRSGAWKWDKEQRNEFFNDEETLSAVTAEVNRRKSDHDPAEWQPPDDGAWCRYAREWIEIKSRYELTADRAEVAALADLLDSCTGPPPDNSARTPRTSGD